MAIFRWVVQWTADGREHTVVSVEGFLGCQLQFSRLFQGNSFAIITMFATNKTLLIKQSTRGKGKKKRLENVSVLCILFFFFIWFGKRVQIENKKCVWPTLTIKEPKIHQKPFMSRTQTHGSEENRNSCVNSWVYFGYFSLICLFEKTILVGSG